MKFATRINSFLRPGVGIAEALHQLSTIEDLGYVDLNYPEHFAEYDVPQMRELLDEAGLKLNSIAMRFRNHFNKGEYTNSNGDIRQEAIELTKRGIDAAAELGSDLVTIWLGFDGFDYTFERDYAKAMQDIILALQEVADYRPDMRLTIEYKPYEERVWAMIPNVGTTLYVLERVARENVGATLDFAHMLMANDMPALGASLFLEKGKLWGIHLNDGNGRHDDGLMAGSIHPFETAELLFYLKKGDYPSVIYFDTFPIREDPVEECRANIAMVKALEARINEVGIEEIVAVVKEDDSVASQNLRIELLKGEVK